MIDATTPWVIRISVHVHKFNETTGGTFCGYCGWELTICR